MDFLARFSCITLIAVLDISKMISCSYILTPPCAGRAIMRYKVTEIALVELFAVLVSVVRAMDALSWCLKKFNDFCDTV